VRAEAEQQTHEQRLADLVGPGGRDLFGQPTVAWTARKAVTELFSKRLGRALESIDEDHLLPWREHDPLIAAYLDFKDAHTRSTRYGKHALKAFLGADGRVRGDYMQIKSTGRLGCRAPSLQQVPKPGAYRACFVAPAGRVLIRCDYSQADLRVLADQSWDAALVGAYQRDEDVHRLTAARLHGCAPEDVLPAWRQLAKSLNFGLCYGEGPAGLVCSALRSGIRLELAEAERFIDTYFQRFPGVAAWQRRQRWFAKRRDEQPPPIVVPSGRRRLGVSRATARFASPIQMIVGDILKTAMAELWRTRAAHPSAALVLCVHDELVLECDQSEASEVADWLRLTMLGAMQRWLEVVPAKVDVSVSRNWAGDPWP
jgi:DNA polymerase-1